MSDFPAVLPEEYLPIIKAAARTKQGKIALLATMRSFPNTVSDLEKSSYVPRNSALCFTDPDKLGALGIVEGWHIDGSPSATLLYGGPRWYC